MEKIFLSFIFIFSLTIVHSFPCPPECICKPTDTQNFDFTRMSYLIDCSNVSLKNDKLVYHAQPWSIQGDKLNDDDDDSTKDYIISIDLSNSLSLTTFTHKTIKLTGFPYLLQSLSLASQSKKFTLNSNAFNSPLYENLNILNLSSCCKQIPKQCEQLFRPLNKLTVLDLSGSDMYKSCLNTPDTISETVRDLILRNNVYDTNTFSHTSPYFNGIRKITGKLDLQNSVFQMGSQLQGNCLFDLFHDITSLDMSSVQFESISNDTEIHLKHLLKCKSHSNITHGEQLLSLYLRQLQLQRLPEWFTNDRFPLLLELDLSNNNIHSIDFSTYLELRYVSIAYNPIDVRKLFWNSDTVYELINLCSTNQNRTFDLSRRLKNLFKLTRNIDYSANEGELPSNITNIPLVKDFSSKEFSLNLSRTNINSFQTNWNDLRGLDISFNSLIELNLDEQIKLKYLDCSNQFLKKLIFNKQLSELIELKCSNNSLVTIENFSLLKNEQLQLIDLSYNRINSLKNFTKNLQSRYLRTINFKSNLIEIIQSNMFSNKLISLYEINLSWNHIDTIESNAFQSPNLQILDLTGNSLKYVEPKAILTSSLRLFYIVNDTQQLLDRCVESISNDTLLSVYVHWFEQNGTYMKNKGIDTIKQKRSDKCLSQYRTQTKTISILQKGKHFLGYYILWISLSVSLIGIIFGGIHCYRNKKLTFLPAFRRYKQLDRDNLVENVAEMDQQQQREDDEIIMNLEEPPFNKLNRGPTNV